tara:strand:+ start:20772 stop:21209 length:438 start_codon:yes stop_codon:yes gene_type:complete
MNLIKRLIMKIKGKKKDEAAPEGIHCKGTFFEKSFVETIAETCHEVNKAYCEGHGDKSQTSWSKAPQWQRDSAVKGVEFKMNNPYALPSSQHDSWMAQKIEEGWTYGETKDAATKTHPCMVGYSELPMQQRIKDILFGQVVDSFI